MLMKKLNIARFAKFGASSAAATVIDAGVFWLVMRLFSIPLGAWAELAATVAGRILSSVANFTINRSLVFKGAQPAGKAMAKYFSLVFVQMLCSAGLVTLINSAVSNEKAIIATVIKLGVDAFLFFISYNIQRLWVFAAKGQEAAGKE